MQVVRPPMKELSGQMGEFVKAVRQLEAMSFIYLH